MRLDRPRDTLSSSVWVLLCFLRRVRADEDGGQVDPPPGGRVESGDVEVASVAAGWPRRVRAVTKEDSPGCPAGRKSISLRSSGPRNPSDEAGPRLVLGRGAGGCAWGCHGRGSGSCAGCCVVCGLVCMWRC